MPRKKAAFWPIQPIKPFSTVAKTPSNKDTLAMRASLTTKEGQVTMSNEFVLGVGPAEKLQTACRRNNCGIELIEWLCTSNNLARVMDIQLGRAEIKPIEHVIDLGASPYLPDGWKVEEHQKGKLVKLERRGDDLYLDGKKIDLFLSKNQKGGCIGGNNLREELAKEPVLNANVLDHLLKPENQHLIPDSWKGKCAFFWGTVYRSADGNLCVRCLYWDGDGWNWNYDWLGNDWFANRPAAVSAS